MNVRTESPRPRLESRSFVALVFVGVLAVAMQLFACSSDSTEEPSPPASSTSATNPPPAEQGGGGGGGGSSTPTSQGDGGRGDSGFFPGKSDKPM